MTEMITIFNRYHNDIELSLSEKGGVILLNGAKRSSAYHPLENRIVGLAGSTLVEKNIWEAWLKENFNNSLLKTNIIFAEVKESEEQAKQEEYVDIKMLQKWGVSVYNDFD